MRPFVDGDLREQQAISKNQLTTWKNQMLLIANLDIERHVNLVSCSLIDVGH